MNNMTSLNLFEQIKNLIEQTKQNVAITINSSLTLMYWNIGKLVNDEIVQNKRAEYGKEIVATLSQQLCEQFGKSGKFWADDYYDKAIRDEKHFRVVYTYIQNNPLKIGGTKVPLPRDCRNVG
jgi:hypothetical protein